MKERLQLKQHKRRAPDRKQISGKIGSINGKHVSISLQQYLDYLPSDESCHTYPPAICYPPE